MAPVLPSTHEGRRVTGAGRCHVCGVPVVLHLAPRRGRQFVDTAVLKSVCGKGASYPDGTLMLRCKAHEHIDPAQWWARSHAP